MKKEVKAGVVQAVPVVFDLKGTLEKLQDLVHCPGSSCC